MGPNGLLKAIDMYSLDDLESAAFEALKNNPGSEFSDWQQTLIYDYPSEVVDAYGCDPEDAEASLANLWESPYNDPSSGLEYNFKTWAEAFATEASVQMYYDMIDLLKHT